MAMNRLQFQAGPRSLSFWADMAANTSARRHWWPRAGRKALPAWPVGAAPTACSFAAGAADRTGRASRQTPGFARDARRGPRRRHAATSLEKQQGRGQWFHPVSLACCASVDRRPAVNDGWDRRTRLRPQNPVTRAWEVEILGAGACWASTKLAGLPEDRVSLARLNCSWVAGLTNADGSRTYVTRSRSSNARGSAQAGGCTATPADSRA
jgi:hypothetical protein